MPTTWDQAGGTWDQTGGLWDTSGQSVITANRATLTAREVRGTARAGRVTYVAGAELPGLGIWWLNATGALIDFSNYTFVMRIGNGSTAVTTKTSNITGAVGSGSEPTGTPNLTIDWTSGDLALSPGVYDFQVIGSSSGLDRFLAGNLVLTNALS